MLGQGNMSVFADSQLDLEALQAPKTMSPLVQQCQKALNDNSTWHMENGY
jgi:hypothetical protein